MPLEGKALAVALAMVKPAPMKGEPTEGGTDAHAFVA
jgi:hypothetical protein